MSGEGSKNHNRLLIFGLIGAIISIFLVSYYSGAMMVVSFGVLLIFLGVLSSLYAFRQRLSSDELGKGMGTIARFTLIIMVATSALAITHEVTEIHIAAVNELEPIFSELMPEAVQFMPVLDRDNEVIYYEAFDDGGMLIGYAFVSVKDGYVGPIKVAGAIDLNYRVVAITIIRHTETPGLGDRITTPQFLDQFHGVSVKELYLSPHGEIDAITGATISSQTVVDTIREKTMEIEAMT